MYTQHTGNIQQHLFADLNFFRCAWTRL